LLSRQGDPGSELLFLQKRVQGSRYCKTKKRAIEGAPRSVIDVLQKKGKEFIKGGRLGREGKMKSDLILLVTTPNEKRKIPGTWPGCH